MKNWKSIPKVTEAQEALIGLGGARIYPIQPIGAMVLGLDLSAHEPPKQEIISVLEKIMADRGFIVIRNEKAVSESDFLRTSCWWGGRSLHSTHSIHPATPGGNPHIFRLSNDSNEGILGVGPQWHNDGSFIADTFSHAGYHMVRKPERGGGTFFAHQAAAFEALGPDEVDYWTRLSSVNATSGVVHPLVHKHPITKNLCVWLHLGMTGAVIEKDAGSEGFRLLRESELRALCHRYNELLNSGLEEGYAVKYEYEENDCLFIDNLTVAHRASSEAHVPAQEQGLRIMHRSTVKGITDLAPDFGLPQYLDIYGLSPLGEGIWQSGGLGFRWDENAPMQN